MTAIGMLKKEDAALAMHSYERASKTPSDDDGGCTVKLSPAATCSNSQLSTTPEDHRDLNMQSYVKSERSPTTPNGNVESVVGGDIIVKLEPGKAPKLARSSSQKVISRPPPLFAEEPDKYEEATSSFEVIDECIYAAKWLGSTEHAMDCDCRENYEDGINHACDEDSDCINRLTKIECTGHGSCGRRCQNRRFHDKAYANVTVFKTEKKGYGLRANTNLQNGDFIYEYLGEVIDEPRFRRRMRQYDDEGIKHFYFMSLNKGEFVDATKKGNLGRFCNHSCNPNCYVDKWVVGDKLCMGIFAGRTVKAGEELVFNYNVDRYGADPQPCYCGEPNCTGFIGGRTQTERATKLSDATIEALGIEDGDSWDTAVAKKPRRPRKTGEDDEEYVNKLQPKDLQEDGVNNLMATLMQCKEKWIAVKLLNRLMQAQEEKVILRVVRMHGYRTLKIVLNEFADDSNVCLQVLNVLHQFPRISRNKIEASGIEDSISKLKANEDERVSSRSAELLELWAQLQLEYRIPRMKRDPNAVAETPREDRKERRARSRSRSRSKSPPTAPTGPRSNMPQRVPGFFAAAPRPAPYRRPETVLPQGWFEAKDPNGKTYYYSATGVTQWTRPLAPAVPAPPPKILTNEERLQQIINDCIRGSTTTPKDEDSTSVTPAAAEPPKKKAEKWRSLPIEKQKKIYENTLFGHIKPTIDKFKGKLPKEELKRQAKDITKKLVESDYKHSRVSNPTKMEKKYSHAAKKHVAEYFNKAVKKHRDHEKKKRDREKQKKQEDEKRKGVESEEVRSTTPPLKAEEEEADIQVSDDEDGEPWSSKRKRDSGTPSTPSEDGLMKKIKMEQPPAPPPPPPPPVDDEVDEEADLKTEEMVNELLDEEAGGKVDDGSATPKGEPKQEPSPADTSLSESREPVHASAKLNGHTSPLQLATPSTSGSGPNVGAP